jgi:predicted porin
MQKKIIALALAGLASSAAFAQTNVTIYGRADMGYVYRGGEDGGVTKADGRGEIASGVASASRIGFKGTEDLGNGLKAIFQAEFGVNMDAETGFANTRNAYAGLNGGFGTVVAGRLDGVRYGVYGKYDAFANGYLGNFTQMTSQVDRANSAIAYISPSFAGLTATLAYSSHIGNSNGLSLASQEGANQAAGNGNDGDAQLATAMLNYKIGGFDVSGDYERVTFRKGAASGAAAVHDDLYVATLGASYDFGVAKIAALYDKLVTSPNTSAVNEQDIQSWFVSGSAPIGKFMLKATYGQTKDKNLDENKSSKLGLGVDYNLSKRTKLYTGYAQIWNDDGAARGLNFRGNAYGVDSGTGTSYGTQGFELGMAHTF